uniref:Uncharacterized protein n=1 Tax=Cacopsylla melanoneura TaxID=428564 RepID=A0A8D9BJD8_9HEMI
MLYVFGDVSSLRRVRYVHNRNQSCRVHVLQSRSTWVDVLSGALPPSFSHHWFRSDVLRLFLLVFVFVRHALLRRHVVSNIRVRVLECIVLEHDRVCDGDTSGASVALLRVEWRPVLGCYVFVL